MEVAGIKAKIAAISGTDGPSISFAFMMLYLEVGIAQGEPIHQ